MRLYSGENAQTAQRKKPLSVYPQSQTGMSKLIQVRKYADSRGIPHMEIKALGCRMRLPVGQLGKYFRTKRRKRHAKKEIRKKLPAFAHARDEYLARQPKNTLRRLFITSGNLHLINTLAIIEQLKESDSVPVENHLLVWSIMTNADFEEMNLKLTQACGITHYYACYGLDEARDVVLYLMEHQLHSVDEVYSLQMAPHMEIYNTLYSGVEHIVTEESFFKLVPWPGFRASSCRQLITTCYLDKMDYAEFAGRAWQIRHIEKTHYSKIARLSAELYPWPLSLPQGSKTIIFCATHTVPWYPYISERQEYIIQRLLNSGFHVLYKPHPRDPQLPPEAENLQILQTRLPLECYALEGVLAVVSLFSSASTQSYHFNGVPGFIDHTATRDVAPEYLCILQEEYTPSVEDLLALNAAQMSHDELKAEISRLYHAHVDPKPMMSQNKRFSEALQAALDEKDNK